MDLEHGRIYADSIPQARFETIPEAGHFPQIEQRDEVQRKILEWGWRYFDAQGCTHFLIRS